MQDIDVNCLSLKKDLNGGIVNQFLRILVDSNSLKSYKESYNILFAPIYSESEWSVIIRKNSKFTIYSMSKELNWAVQGEFTYNISWQSRYCILIKCLQSLTCYNDKLSDKLVKDFRRF